MQAGASKLADRRRGQRGLFGDDDDASPQAAVAHLPDVPEWDERDKLAKEKEVLGYYLTSHPLAEHAEALRAFSSHTSKSAAEQSHRTEVMLGGMIAAIKQAHIKTPKPGAPSRYAMFDLEDTEGIMRCILWPEGFVQFGELVQPEAIVVIRGSIDKRPGSEDANLIVNEIIPRDQLEARYTRGAKIRVLESEHGLKKLEMLHEILRGYPGSAELQLIVGLADGGQVSCRCDGLKIRIDPEMRRRVDELLGPGHFRLITAPPSSSPPSRPRRNGNR
jgi:DNA polymerase-3 subunit alpha